MRIARRFALFSAAVMIATPIYAQGKLAVVPISKDVVVLQVVVGQRAPVRLVGLNGGLNRLALRNGPTIALIPVLGAGAVTVTVMDVVTDPASGSESARQIAKANVALGNSIRFDDAGLSLEIGLTEIRPPAGGAAVATAGSCKTCCLTCGDLTACSCAVEMDCGKCCCPGGDCGCDIEGGPTAGEQVDAVAAPDRVCAARSQTQD